MGEGAFSDEIRSRGRSEFGYLIRERGVKERGNSGNKDARGCAGACLDPRLFFARSFAACKMGLRRIPHFKRRFIPPRPVPSDPPTFLLPTSCWDELTIDRIDTVAAGEPRVCRLGTRVSPAAVASIFLAKLHPSPLPPRSDSPSSVPRANAYVVKPFFHYEIVTA